MDDTGIIYLRLSDFADDDDAGTFQARADELQDLAAGLGVTARVAVENDIDGNGRMRGASAFKARDKVTAASGLVTYRTRRPTFHGVLLDLQTGAAGVLIVQDESRITRDHRDGYDLLDACTVGGASVVAQDDDGGPRYVLTRGGTRTERSAFLRRVDDARRYSEDIGAKVSKGRRRWAGRSWQGGRRPYGYRIQEDTAEHARNLVPDQAEAAVLNDYGDRLLAGTSLRRCIADLRTRAASGEPGCGTVTGATWSTRSLRDALIKPATAGLAVKGGELVPAPWPAIIERPKWDRIRALLLDPARRKNENGNEPRHLVSVFATCGVCGKLMKIGGGGTGHAPAYTGAECGHIRRNAAKVDELVAETALVLLERPAVLARLQPPARPTVDVAGLNGELAKLGERRARYQGLAAAGQIADDDLVGVLAGIRQRETAIGRQLATSSAAPDVLAVFREAPARVVWEGLDMSLKRAVVKRLFAAVVINPTGRGSRFDPDAIDIRPRPEISE